MLKMGHETFLGSFKAGELGFSHTEGGVGAKNYYAYKRGWKNFTLSQGGEGGKGSDTRLSNIEEPPPPTSN